MLVAIAIILVILWVLGLITKIVLGGILHLLLLLAIVAILIHIIQGRNPL